MKNGDLIAKKSPYSSQKKNLKLLGIGWRIILKFFLGGVGMGGGLGHLLCFLREAL